jgi:hypothetical protein
MANRRRVKICIIKGNKFEAAQAAASRKIPFVFEKETRGQTVGLTTASERALNSWLGKGPFNPPFPVGTLLFWNYK